MQKHLLYIPLIALSSALALTACSDEVTNTLTPDLPIGEKSPIELSVGGVDGAQTRAVITDYVSEKQFEPVAPGTYIYMLMKSDYVSLPEGFTNLNFGGAQTTKYSVTRGEVVKSSDASKNDVKFSDTRIRYWDDAHARSSKLSIWAIMCPGLNHLGGIGANLNDNNVKFNTTEGLKDWQTTTINANAIEWNVPHYNKGNYQTEETLKNRDLCFSNNIADYTSSSDTDRRLGFKTPDKKFEGGNLVFYHALSKITVNIQMGDGFTGTDDFRFTETETLKNSQLRFFNIWGKFNLETGEWAEVNNDHQAITGMWNITGTIPNTTDATKPTYQLQALVIPYLSSDTKTTKGSILNDDKNTKAIVFTIDNNKYEVSRADLLKALQDKADNGVANNATSVALEAGKHYIFTFTVGKTQIKNITAQVVGWEDVVADEFDASNARIKLNLEERGSDLTSSDSFSFYRAEKNNTGEINDDYTTYDWKTGYRGNEISPTYVAASGTTPAHWTTSWFWNNSLNYYHFRALAKMNGTAKVAVEDNVVTDATNGDYLALNHAETSYTDILWGAPMTDYAQNEVSDAENLKWNYGPTANGFDGLDTKATDAHQIYKAIGPTKDAIKLILFHMMSDVTFKIKTTTGADKVNLGTGTGTDVTTIKLEKIHKEGKLYMGNGLVLGSTADVANSSYTFEATPAPDSETKIITWSNYGAIPQSLADVVLVITTPDHNQYKVAMKDVLATSVNTNNIANPYSTVGGSGDDKNKYKIDRWYPGFKYTYTFTLKKTGITDLQVTILDWETVEAGNQDVVIQ